MTSLVAIGPVVTAEIFDLSVQLSKFFFGGGGNVKWKLTLQKKLNGHCIIFLISYTIIWK